jgi:hypothetical protein
MASKFFDSEIVRKEAKHIEMLETKALMLASEYPFKGLNASKKEKHFVSTVKELLEKQQIFYARIRLSQDPEANEMLNKLDYELSDICIRVGSQDSDSLLKDLLKEIEKDK